MTSKDRNLSALVKGFILISLMFLFALNAASFAAEEDESITYQGKKYDISYFFAISGEVYGQAAPGVEAVIVNGIPVRVEKDLTFKALVFLKEGEKYLSIETQYQGLRFIKRYLVIRHPKVQKTFKINVPEKEFKEIVKKAETIKKPAPVKKRPPEKKAPEVTKEKTPEVMVKEEAPKIEKLEAPKISLVAGESPYILIIELEPGKILLVKQENGKFFGYINYFSGKVWYPIQEITYQEFKDLLEKGKLPPSFAP